MKNELKLKDALSRLRTMLEQSAKLKQDLKDNITWAEKAKPDCSSEAFARDVLPKIEQMKINTRIQNNQIYSEVVSQLKVIEELMQQNQQGLDLSRPEWNNALRLIEMAGPNISGDLVRQINATFAGDVPALKALQTVYKSKGIKYDGGLDEQIGNPERSFEYLRDFAYASICQDISVNSFANAVNKVIKPSGVEFRGITGSVMVESARHAAGLPEVPGGGNNEGE